MSNAVDRTAWLEQRRSGIGGSDAATLFDANPYDSRLALYYDKIGESEPDETSEPAYWGTLLEPAVRQAYQDKTGRVVGQGLVMARHPECPWMIANTDGTIEPVPVYTGPGIYEGKVTTMPFGGVKQHGDLSLVSWAEGVPLYHQIQGQHYAAVSGWTWVGFACLTMGKRGDPLERRDMERNDRFIEVLMERAHQFWHEHVVPRVPPPADGSEASRKALLYAFPKSSGRVFIMPPDLAELAVKYEEASAQEREAKKTKKAIGNAMRQAMGDASYAYGGDDAPSFSYKEKAKALGAAEVLDVCEEMMGEPFRDQVEVALEQKRTTYRELRQASRKTVKEALEHQPAEQE